MIPAAQGGPDSAENRTYTMGIGMSRSHLDPGRRGPAVHSPTKS